MNARSQKLLDGRGAHAKLLNFKILMFVFVTFFGLFLVSHSKLLKFHLCLLNPWLSKFYIQSLSSTIDIYIGLYRPFNVMYYIDFAIIASRWINWIETTLCLEFHTRRSTRHLGVISVFLLQCLIFHCRPLSRRSPARPASLSWLLCVSVPGAFLLLTRINSSSGIAVISLLILSFSSSNACRLFWYTLSF